MVRDARLLGFLHGRCTEGHEVGERLVRSIWRAEVSLNPWEPHFEIAHRKLVPDREVLACLTLEPVYFPILRRALVEAGIMC